MHLKPRLGYADYIADGRASEETLVLEFIVEASKDCDTVVFLGDQLNAKHNDSETITKYVNFLERFDGKELFIISGNHTKFADGRTAEDFLKEVKDKKWHVITTEPLKTPEGLVFCPYMHRSELGESDNAKAAEKLIQMLPDGKELFVHHAISETSGSGVNTGFFDEIVLDKSELDKKYGRIIAGHVHKPYMIPGLIVAGSVFTNEVGEEEKFIYKILTDEASRPMKAIPLPIRPIYKVDDSHATVEHLRTLKKNAIVKIVLTAKLPAAKMEELRSELRTFDAHILLENYPTERRKAAIDKDILSVSVEELLEIYAKQKDVDLDSLMRGWKMLKNFELK